MDKIINQMEVLHEVKKYLNYFVMYPWKSYFLYSEKKYSREVTGLIPGEINVG